MSKSVFISYGNLLIRNRPSSMFRNVEMQIDLGYLEVDVSSARTVRLPDGTTRLLVRASCPSRWHRAIIRHRNDTVDLTGTFEMLGRNGVAGLIEEDDVQSADELIETEAETAPTVPRRRRIQARRRVVADDPSPRSWRAINSIMMEDALRGRRG